MNCQATVLPHLWSAGWSFPKFALGYASSEIALVDACRALRSLVS
jgi:hypothetical protein